MKKNLRDKAIAMTLAVIMTASPVWGAVFAADEAVNEKAASITAEEIMEQAEEMTKVEEKAEEPAEEVNEKEEIRKEEIKAPAEAEVKEETKAEEKAEVQKEEVKAEEKVEAKVEEKAEEKVEIKAEEKAAETEVKAEAPKSEAAPKEEAASKQEEAPKAEAQPAAEKEQIKRASSYKVTIVLDGIKATDGSESSATLSYTVSVSGTKTIAASTLNAKVKTKSFKLNGVTYKFESLWADASGNKVASIVINGDDLWAPTELVYRAVYSATPDKKVTVNFKNIYKADGTMTSSTESNTLSAGSGWSFTQKKLDNKVTVKSFSHNGTKYEYAGKWVDDEGNEFTSFSIKNADLEGDTEFNFYPVYNITETKKFKLNYIDNVSTGSGSWANIDSFTSMSHTFRQPEAQKHYLFVNWKSEDTDATYVQGDKFTVNYSDLEAQYTEYKVFAVWQPSVTVRYHFNGQTIENESFEDINVYSQASEINGIAYDGWYDEEGTLLDESKVFEAPAVVTEKTERTVYDVYARRPVTITAASASWTYDGNAHSEDAFEVTAGGLFEGDMIEAEISGSVTEAAEGEIANKIDNIRIMRDGQDVSGYYNITGEDGTLRIDPVSEKVTVIITENSANELYDGSEKTLSGYEVSIDHELYTEDDFSFDGVAEVRGTEAGTYEMEISAADFTNNNDNFSDVEFEIEDGELTIEALPVIPAETEDEPAAPEAPAAEIKDEPAAPAAEIKDEPAAPAAEIKDEPAAPAAEIEEESAVPAARTSRPAAATTQNISIADNEEPAQATVIENNAQPKAAPVEIIENETPLASTPAWALINLIMTIVTGLISAVLLAGWFGKKEEDEEAEDEDNRTGRKGFVRLTSLIPAAISVIAFILTENMNNPMVLIDRWTIFMAAILLIQAAVALLARKDSKEEEDNEAAEAMNA